MFLVIPNLKTPKSKIEISKFIKKWEWIRNTEKLLLSEDYEKFRNAVRRLDEEGKIKNLYKTLQKMEKEIDLDFKIKEIDELSEKSKSFSL